jgi:hypothetical protein
MPSMKQIYFASRIQVLLVANAIAANIKTKNALPSFTTFAIHALYLRNQSG